MSGALTNDSGGSSGARRSTTSGCDSAAGEAPRRDRAGERLTGAAGLAAGFAADLVMGRVARGRSGTAVRVTRTRIRGATRCVGDPPRGRVEGAGSGFGNDFASGVGSGFGVAAGAGALNTSATAAIANETPERRSNDEEPQVMRALPSDFVARLEATPLPGTCQRESPAGTARRPIARPAGVPVHYCA
jgi:hypothetical protein